jgi:hypothetical protein
MANNTISINKVVSILRDIQIRNPLTNTFFYGSGADFNALKNVIYPSFIVEQSSTIMKQSQQTLGYQTEFLGFNLYVMDRINKGDSNYQELLSDCLYSLQTMITEIDNHIYYIELGMSIVEDISFEPVIRADDDDIQGWMAKIKFKIPIRYTPCNNPIQPITGFTVSLDSNTSQYRMIGATGPQGPIGPQGNTGPAGKQSLATFNDVLKNGNTSSIGFDIYTGNVATSGMGPNYIYIEDSINTTNGVFMEVVGTNSNQAQVGFFNNGFTKVIISSDITTNHINIIPNKGGTFAMIDDVNNISATLSNYVPYTGAITNVDLGSNELTIGKLYLYDEVGGPTTKGSLHYADEALHFENSDNETLFYVEPGFVQLHKTGAIQSNLYTTYLTQNRDHYLPDLTGTILLDSNKNTPNGIAGLDLNGIIPTSILPDSVLGNTKFKGTFDPITTTFSATSSNLGWYYISIGIGTYSGLNFNIGDWMISEGTFLSKVDNTDAVMSVNGRMGYIIINSQDITDGLGYTPSNITSLANYLTIASASSTYATTATLSNYYLTSNPDGYITASSVSGYLTVASASATYLTITSASSTYATIATLSNYLPLIGGTISGGISVQGITIGKGNSGIATNTAVGNVALATISTGTNNVGVGFNSLNADLTGSFNTAVGSNSLSKSTASSNSAYGYSALFNNTTGNLNVALGGQALLNNIGGGSNVAVGNNALLAANLSNDTAVGALVLTNLNTGGANTALGYASGRFIANGSTTLTSLSNSILIGYQSYPLANGDSNEIVIGFGSIGAGSNTTTIGNTSTTSALIYGALSVSNMISTGTQSGFLPNKMTNTQRVAISSPVVASIVYQTDTVGGSTEGLYIYKSTGWIQII